MQQALKNRSWEPVVHELPLEHLEHEICQLRPIWLPPCAGG